jgi:hypothetical protein
MTGIGYEKCNESLVDYIVVQTSCSTHKSLDIYPTTHVGYMVYMFMVWPISHGDKEVRRKKPDD